LVALKSSNWHFSHLDGSDPEERLLRAGEAYRQFRVDLQRLRAIEKEEIQILMAILSARAVHYE
jgi:hypothetical protein